MTLYEQILTLPLFQGLSHNDLSDIVAHTRFEFHKADTGYMFINEGSPCKELTFLLKGEAIIHSHSDDYSYSVSETLPAPQMFGLAYLFGLMQYHPSSVIAETPCSLITLTKEDIMRLADQYFIIRINLLNRLATAVQRMNHSKWTDEPKDISGSVVKFFVVHCQYPAGHKVFNIKMEELARLTHQSRLNVSRLLNKWQDTGLVKLGRSRTDIPHLEALIQLKDNA